MDVIAAGCLSIAILSLGLAILRGSASSRPPQRLFQRLLTHHRQRLAEARIAGSPQPYVAMTFMAPVGLFAIGWLQSPVLAVLAGAGGLMAPRLFLASL